MGKKQLSERLSIGNKIGVLLAIMVIVAGINVAAVYYYQSEASTLGNSVDYAGEQRMLSQRIAFIGYMMSQGHDDSEIMQAAIDKYDRNLEGLLKGGEIDGKELQPAPSSIQDELQEEQEFWETYKTHAQTLVEENPYNPEFQDSLDYLLDHRSEFVGANSEVIDGYSAAGETYMTERGVAQSLQTNTQSIFELALEIKHVTSQPGSESIEKVELQSGETVTQIQAELAKTVNEYDATLTALETGGTYDGTDLQSPPKEVESTLAGLGDQWADLEPHANTIASENRLNPSFWKSLSYVETNSDQLRSISDEVVSAFSTLSTEQISFMQQILLGLFGVNVLVFGFGVFVARRYIGKPVREIAEVATEISEGDVEVDISDRVSVNSNTSADEERVQDELIHLTASFENLGDYLTTVSDQAVAIADQDFDAAVLEEDVPGTFGESIDRMAADVETAQTAAEEARREVEQLNNAIETKAQAYNEAMEKAARGDLTIRVDPESQSESMTKIGAAFNEMIEGIEKTVVQVQTLANDVADATSEVATSADEIEAASQDVAESVQEISQGADDQVGRLQTAADEMNELSATVEEIASSADEVSKTARDAVAKADDGSEHAEDATEELGTIEAQSELAVNQVTNLQSEIANINEIVQLISEIAEQTNLLALNASIEAARAGEAGEGFAVVADEIKTLANEAGSATTEIEQLIEEIQASTDETVEDIETMVDNVEHGSRTIKDAIAMFDTIAETVSEAENGISEISRATDDQAASTEEVVAMVEEVTDLSEQTAGEATNVSSATEEQTASINSVSGNIGSLSDVAENLHAVVEQFDVEEGEKGAIEQNTPDVAEGTVSTDGGNAVPPIDDEGNEQFDWREID